MQPYYNHTGITIYHGDCRDVLPTLEPVDLVIADPPYGIKKTRGAAPVEELVTTEGYTKVRLLVVTGMRLLATMYHSILLTCYTIRASCCLAQTITLICYRRRQLGSYGTNVGRYAG